MRTAEVFEKRVAYQKSLELNQLVIEICKRIPPDQLFLVRELSISSMKLMRYMAIHYGTEDESLSKQAGRNAQAGLAQTMNALLITHQYGWLSDEEKSEMQGICMKIKPNI
jgi:hypothetical protein